MSSTDRHIIRYGTNVPVPDWASRITSALNSLPPPEAFPSYRPEGPLSSHDVAQMIDHTLLTLTASEEEIDMLCMEALEHDFRSVCVRLPWVSRCASIVLDSTVRVCCVVGFHEGTQPTSRKVEEAQRAVSQGAQEIDMVINFPLLKAPDVSTSNEGVQRVFEDILSVRRSLPEAVLKCILETSQLTTAEIVAGCLAACEAGADFVKTSTGFNGRGASVSDVQVMRWITETYGEEAVDVKASGGIGDATKMKAMVMAGAKRIGATKGLKILETMSKREARSATVPANHDDY